MTEVILPKLPPELFSDRWTLGQKQQRLMERKRIMEECFRDPDEPNPYAPQPKFSAVASNPLGIAEARRLGIPGVGLPRLIYDNLTWEAPYPAAVDRVVEAYRSIQAKLGRRSPFVTYTTLMLAAGLFPDEIFGVLRYMQAEGYKITHTVDRLGNDTACKIEGKEF